LTADSFTFAVACSFEGAPVPGFPRDVVLALPAGATSVTSDPIRLLPVGAVCVTTETGAGHADAPAGPVTTTIAADGVDNTATVTLDNAYSAGTIAITKQLRGRYADSDEIAERVFRVRVVCRVGTGSDQRPVVDTEIPIRGGETQVVVDDAGAPVVLPVGSSCWAQETDDGGADESDVDHDRGNPILVTAGDPNTLQAKEITVTNTFSTRNSFLPGDPDDGDDNDPHDGGQGHPDAGGLPNLGGPAAWVLFVGGALLAGGLVVLRRGRDGKHRG
jgi:large repetitive protein